MQPALSPFFKKKMGFSLPSSSLEAAVHYKCRCLKSLVNGANSRTRQLSSVVFIRCLLTLNFLRSLLTTDSSLYLWIGHFRVVLCLGVKISLLVWEDSFWNRGTIKLGNDLLKMRESYGKDDPYPPRFDDCWKFCSSSVVNTCSPRISFLPLWTNSHPSPTLQFADLLRYSCWILRDFL